MTDSNDQPKAECYDCQMDYDDFPCDFGIQDELWAKISPSGNGGSLLCPNCMCRRMSNKLGMCGVSAVVITNGIEIDNNLLVKVVNIWFLIRNRYRQWRLERWLRRLDT